MIVLAVLISATIPYAPCGVGQFLVVCGYHTTIAADGHVLCRIEGEASGITDGTDLLSSEFGSVCLARIFDKTQAGFSRDLTEFIYSRWESVKVHWRNCSSLGANLSPGLTRTQVYS